MALVKLATAVSQVLLASQHKLARANIKLLQDLGLDDIELDVQPVTALG